MPPGWAKTCWTIFNISKTLIASAWRIGAQGRHRQEFAVSTFELWPTAFDGSLPPA